MIPVAGIKAGSGATGISFDESELDTPAVDVEFEAPLFSKAESGVRAYRKTL